MLLLGQVRSHIESNMLAVLEITGHLRFALRSVGPSRRGVVVQFIPRVAPVWFRRARLAAGVVGDLAPFKSREHRYVVALELIRRRFGVYVFDAIVVHCTGPEVAGTVKHQVPIAADVEAGHRFM